MIQEDQIEGPRVSIATSGATLTPDISSFDSFERTAQAESLTIANPTGTIGNFEGFQIKLKSDGTARTLTMGAKYVAYGQAFPSQISATKTLVITCIYNSTNDTYMTVTTEEV